MFQSTTRCPIVFRSRARSAGIVSCTALGNWIFRNSVYNSGHRKPRVLSRYAQSHPKIEALVAFGRCGRATTHEHPPRGFTQVLRNGGLGSCRGIAATVSYISSRRVAYPRKIVRAHGRPSGEFWFIGTPRFRPALSITFVKPCMPCAEGRRARAMRLFSSSACIRPAKYSNASSSAAASRPIVSTSSRSNSAMPLVSARFTSRRQWHASIHWRTMP